MEDKQKIIEIIQKINDEKQLAFILQILKRMGFIE